MIEMTFKTIVYIDHVVNFSIVRQITLNFNNIDKFNFRLIRAFIYFSQFQLNVRYRSKKQHIIFDALFRLSTFFVIETFESVIEAFDINTYHNEMKNSELSNQMYVY